ncbi:ankyrin repeat domain-containing protein [Rosenbergiella epipactidis]|uniref:ankyrin repeat domain-containing protein n=1 Tax=Rosenbergiella epipactidis TaxID=1544694 RepID=UPI001F4D3AB5|nr:ankyrin repeat domain-containing protein [Rosenbergiella epipactidis]
MNLKKVISVFLFALSLLYTQSSFATMLNADIAEAARNGDISTVSKALHSGSVSINDADENGYTMLILSIYHDQEKMASYLLSQNADPNQSDNHGRTALMGAAFKGDLNSADILLGDKRTLINLQNPQGQTAAMYAALFGHIQFLQNLTAKGAKLDIQDKQGNSCMTLALQQGNSAIAEWIKKQAHNS